MIDYEIAVLKKEKQRRNRRTLRMHIVLKGLLVFLFGRQILFLKDLLQMSNKLSNIMDIRSFIITFI